MEFILGLIFVAAFLWVTLQQRGRKPPGPKHFVGTVRGRLR